jgi:hypothetical protein
MFRGQQYVFVPGLGFLLQGFLPPGLRQGLRQSPIQIPQQWSPRGRGQPPEGSNPAHIPPRGGEQLPQGANPGHTPPFASGLYGDGGQHTHTELPYKKLSEAGDKAYKLFKNKGHYAHDLSKMVEEACKNLGSDKMSKYQAEGFGTLKKSMRPGAPPKKNGSSFLANSGFELGKDWAASDEKVLDNFYKKFDQLFFFGTMAGRCSWEIDWETNPNVLGYCQTNEEFGYNTQVGGRSPHQRSVIRLQRNHGQDRQKRLVEYLGVLLHEMCHSFMGTWSCDARSCFQNSELVGVSGHGGAWQNTCVAVDEAVQKHFRLKLPFSRPISYALEMVEAGLTTPSKHCARWGITMPELNKFIAGIKQQKQAERLGGRFGGR